MKKNTIHWKCKECDSNKKSSYKLICLKCYYLKNRFRISNKFKQWYKKNKIYKINQSLYNLKNNNYAYEKTKEQKIVRGIKRRTRLLYPLKGKKCEFCENNAIEHHHYTKPIQIDKFNYVCHKCHNKIINKRRV